MIRRTLRGVLRVVIVVVALIALLLTALWLTNPRPGDSAGWERLADMPLPRGEVAAAVLGDRLFVIGGLRGFTTTSDAISSYDIRRDRWMDAGTLPPRHHAAAAALGGRVYVTGGARSVFDWDPSDDMHAFRPGSEPARSKMPEGRQGHAMVAHDGKLYVVGGAGRTDRTLIYDVAERAWSVGAAIPEGRDHLRAVVWGDRVWALGGRSGGVLSRVDVYDPERDTWAPGPDLPEPMSAMAVGVLDDALHVVGGEDPSLLGGVSSRHFVLRGDTSRWEEATAPVLAVHGAAYGVHTDKLIVAAGASRQGALSAISWTPVTQAFSPG